MKLISFERHFVVFMVARSFEMKIGFIGAGNMAQAIVKGLLGSYPAKHIVVSAPTDRNLAFFEQLGCRTSHDNNVIVTTCDVVFLCIKPAQCDIAFREVSLPTYNVIHCYYGYIFLFKTLSNNYMFSFRNRLPLT